MIRAPSFSLWRGWVLLHFVVLDLNQFSAGRRHRTDASQMVAIHMTQTQSSKPLTCIFVPAGKHTWFLEGKEGRTYGNREAHLRLRI